MSRRTRVAALLSLPLLLAGLGGCGSDDGSKDEAGSVPEDASTVSASDGRVSTRYPVLVLEQGEGSVACLGGAADSAPPQCKGQSLAGWDWDEHPEHRVSGGVRWGDFALTGLWDGETLTVTDAVAAEQYDGPRTTQEQATSACPEPEGGWQDVDSAKVSSAALDETLRRATQLPGYAEAWLVTEGAAGQEREVINVRVTTDAKSAEKTLRKSWGGPLCVTEGEFDEAELVDLTTKLQKLPGVLNTSAFGGVITLTVVYDEGSLQEQMDDEYGEGRVEVGSALIPAEG